MADGSVPPPRRRLRTAVVGVGYFGRFHAAKYAARPDAELVAAVDIDAARADTVAREFGCAGATDYRRIIDRVDAVSIATPPQFHCELACAFLSEGKHVLVEKPMALSLAEADRMIAVARRAGVVLQIGHQERFLFDRFAPPREAHRPREIVCRRAGPANGRGGDCSVVLDVMIHDLDLVHRLVAGEADGPSIARLDLDRGDRDRAEVGFTIGACAVRLSASRVHPVRERSIRVRGEAGDDFAIDFVARRFTRAGGAGECAPVEFPAEDLLRLEIEDFFEAIALSRAPRVSGEDGRRALATALLIEAASKKPRAPAVA